MKYANAYANAYVAGVGVGLALLAAFVLTGHGLQVVGAYSLDKWVLNEMVGVALGGAISAAISGRLRVAIERGPRMSAPLRLVTAALGGVAMGLGAKLARGCTSGLALSGGAVLSIGAFVFIICAFAAGYVIVPVWRRLWT